MKNIFIIITVFVFCFLFYAPRASAQPLGLSISPALITVKTDGKNETTAKITIQNETDHNVSYSITFVPFQPSLMKNGEPILLAKTDNDYNSLFQNVLVLENDIPITKLDFAPRQKKSVKLVINPPTALKNKDYYFTVIFTSLSTSRPETKTTVVINQAAGVNILLSFGKLDQPQGEIKEFTSQKLLNKGPVSFSLDIENKSQSFITAYGNISVKNMFGQTVGSFDLEKTNILKGSERTINASWNEKFLLGIYSVKADVSLSPTGPVLTKETRFFAFPLEYSIITLICVVILIYLGVRIAKKRSKS